MSARPYSNYQDPYQTAGAEYLDDQARYESNTAQAANEQHYGQYNSYHNSTNTLEKNAVDDDGVDALGEIGGTERERPGRTGLHQPTSSFAAMGPPPRSTGILRMWRKDERGKQWTRGGGFKSTGRLVFCCLVITLLLVISVLLTILMFVRPPSVTLSQPVVVPGSVDMNQSSKQFQVKINLHVTVANPNWFNGYFSKIKATVRYPGVPTSNFGGGQVTNANFVAYKVSGFDFPISLNYSSVNDPGQEMLSDLAKKCGSGNGDMTIDYGIDLWLKVLSATIKPPTISSSATFTCPFGSEIGQLLG